MTDTKTRAERRAMRKAVPPAPARWRNIWIYAAGVMALSVVASFGIEDNESPAALLFIVSPILMACALRWFGGDGWKDAGLRLRGRAGWYVLAALLFPVLLALPMVIGAATGDVTFADDAASGIPTAIAAILVPVMVYALFEEWGWRGYLEPRLDALGVPAARRHLAVAALWGVWHVPYILALGDSYADIPAWQQIPLFLVAIVAMAFIWGVSRTATGSVWPAVIGHGAANAVAYPLFDKELVEISTPLVYAARPEGLIVLAATTAVAVAVFRRWGRRAG